MSVLTVENILCHGEFRCELQEGVNVITGKNTAGKTSLALIIAALAAHHDNPASVSATSKKVYIKDGALEGSAVLDGVKWLPQSGGIGSPPGQAPSACQQAVGLVDFLGGKGVKERSKLWEAMFLPTDARAVLTPFWPSNVSTKQMEVVLDIIEKRGWDAALSIYEQKRLEFKQRWQVVTGEPRYGAGKGANWLPGNWSPEIEGRSKEDLDANLTDSRDALTAANSVQAVEQDRIDRAVYVRDVEVPQKQDEFDAAKKTHDSAQKEARELSQKYSEQKAEYDALVQRQSNAKALLGEKAPHQCPACKTGLHIEAGQIKAFVSRGEKQVAEAEALLQAIGPQIAALGKQLQGMVSLATAAKEKRVELHAKMTGLEAELNQMKRQTADASLKAAEGATDAEVARLQTAVQEANDRLGAYTQHKQAKEAHENVVEYEKICTILGPSGARDQIMSKWMDQVRKVLANIESATGWESIKILQDYSISSNNRPIKLTSDNEKLKAQWCMQIASAMLTKSKWLVLDKADTLKDESWTGLIGLVGRLVERRPDMKIVICGTSIGAAVTDKEGWNIIQIAA